LFLAARDPNFQTEDISFRTEVAGVTFSDSDSALVPKFFSFDPGPPIFQILESDSYSDFNYNHRSNRNLPMFLLKKWPHRLLHCRNWKVTPIRIRFFTNFWLRVRKKNAESCRSRLWHSGSGSTSDTQAICSLELCEDEHDWFYSFVM